MSSLCLTVLLTALGCFSQSYSQQDAEVDVGGVLRWKDTKDEVSLFGVKLYDALRIFVPGTQEAWPFSQKGN